MFFQHASTAYYIDWLRGLPYPHYWYDLFSLHKYEKYGKYQTHERSKMIPMKLLSAKKHYCKDCKHDQSYRLLYDFKLHQSKRTSITRETHAISWNLTAIFEEGDTPGNEDYDNKRGRIGNPLKILHLKMTIPCKSHKNIGDDKQQNSIKNWHTQKYNVIADSEVLWPDILRSIKG